MKEYNPKYWSGIGKYEKEYHRLFEKLVPDRGRADTFEGELLRHASLFYYKRYNDGYYIAKSARFLNNHKNKFGFKDSFKKDMTDKNLDIAIDKIVLFVLKNEKRTSFTPRKILKSSNPERIWESMTFEQREDLIKKSKFPPKLKKDPYFIGFSWKYSLAGSIEREHNKIAKELKRTMKKQGLLNAQ